MRGEVELAQLEAVPPPSSAIDAVEDALAQLAAVEDLVHRPILRIRVLDDDPGLADVTSRRLRLEGFHVESGGTPGGGEPEVVIADLGLLETLPPDVVDSIRACRPIVVSGAGDESGRAAAETFGAIAYLQKPVVFEDLLAAIRRRSKAGF